MHIQGFHITETRVKNKGFSFRDILIFPLLIIGAPFIAIGVFFFSVLDKFKNKEKSDWAKLTETWNGIEFELTVLDEQNQRDFNIDQEAELFSITSEPIIPLFDDFFSIDYLFTQQHGFFMGFNKDSKHPQLIILTENTSFSVDLGKGNWAFEDDHHHESNFCQLRKWEDKTSSIFTLKPVKA